MMAPCRRFMPPVCCCELRRRNLPSKLVLQRVWLGYSKSVSLLDEAVNDIRGYIGTLRPQPNTKSLTAGLQELASADHLRSMVEVNLDLNLPESQPLSPAQVGHLLAIVNEALSNVVRHAQASQIHLSATTTDNWLSLEIRDNGRGLPHDYVVGYGLRNMQERARLLAGQMVLNTQPGQGTVIKIDVPCYEKDNYVTNFTG